MNEKFTAIFKLSLFLSLTYIVNFTIISRPYSEIIFSLIKWLDYRGFFPILLDDLTTP